MKEVIATAKGFGGSPLSIRKPGDTFLVGDSETGSWFTPTKPAEKAPKGKGKAPAKEPEDEQHPPDPDGKDLA